MNATETSIPGEVLSAALALNDAQRLALGHQLIDSVEVNPNDPTIGWPEDWEEELERRALAVEQGGRTYSIEEVMAHARETIKVALQAKADRDVVS